MVFPFVCVLLAYYVLFYFLLAGASTIGNWDLYIYREKEKEKGGIYSRVGINSVDCVVWFVDLMREKKFGFKGIRVEGM